MTYMVSVFYNDYDPASRRTQKRGKAIVLGGPNPSLKQLLDSIAASFRREDLSVGYNHFDGTSIIIDSDVALKTYLESFGKSAQRPVLQCFDSQYGDDDRGLPPLGPSSYHQDSVGSSGHSHHSPYTSVGSQNAPTPTPPMSRSATPSRPNSAMGGQRSTSAMSMHSTMSVPVETTTGSLLDEEELRWHFSKVSKDNSSATKQEILKYLQDRYDDMGDPKRFQRLLDKFPRRGSLNFDEFCIVLLRLAAG